MTNETWKTHIVKAINEAYDGSGGVYLDRGTNLLAELTALNGAQASTVLPGAGNSVANQIRHLLTTVKMHEPQFNGGDYPELDWGADWAEVTLGDNEWQELVATFAATREQLIRWVISPTVEENEEYAGAAVMVATHHAYHVGQIRHAAGYAAQH